MQSLTLSVADPAFRQAIADVISRIRATGRVKNIRSPYARGNDGQISHDGHSALVGFDIKGAEDDAASRVTPVLAAVALAERAHPDLRVEEFGEASAARALDDTVGKDFKRAEILSIPVTLVVLLVAFGALLAAGIPVVLAITSFIGSLGLLALSSRLFPVDDAANSVMLLIGLAVGVDYSLFYLKREREERAAGNTARAALEAATATSGHAVLVSGLTVIVAMAGMFLAGQGSFTGIAVATILVVAMSVLGSLTVLPALLGRLGDRVEAGRLPFLSRRRAANGAGFWGAVTSRVLRRPLLASFLAGGALVALAAPALALHTSIPGAEDLPQNLPVMQTYQRIQQAFPGSVSPATVVVHAPDVTSPQVRRAITELRRRALASGRMQRPITVDVSPKRRWPSSMSRSPATVQAIPSRSARSARSAQRSFLPRSGASWVSKRPWAARSRPRPISTNG